MTHVIQNPCEKLQLMFVLKLVDVDDVIVFNFRHLILIPLWRGGYVVFFKSERYLTLGMIFLLKF